MKPKKRISGSKVEEAHDDRVRPVLANPRMLGALCDECPLRGAMPVYDEGPEAPRLAIVGEAPGRDEVDAGLPFIGRSGQYVSDLLRRRGLNRSDVLLANAVSCFPPGGDMKAFIQREKKNFKDDVKAMKDAAVSPEEKKAQSQRVFRSPIDCCRPRLMFQLGVPRCSACLRWDLPGASAKIACDCAKPRWVRSKYGQPLAIIAGGNAALESLRGDPGITEKQCYVFGEEKGRSK